MKKFLAITICFVLFLSVFATLIYFDSHRIHAEVSLSHKDHCHISYLFQKDKEKNLKLPSLLKLNLDNFYLARAQSLDFDTVSNFQQKLKQTKQLLAVVKIE